MKRRVVALFAAAAAAGAVLLILLPARRAEPKYQDRTLDSWLGDFESDKPNAQLLAAEAIRQMGTNVVPFLVERLRHSDPRGESRLRSTLRDIGTGPSPIKFSVPHARLRREEALCALDALGESATNAIPALKLLLHKDSPDYRALLILARMGPAGTTALTTELTNNDRIILDGSRICLELMQARSEVLFPRIPQPYDFQRRQCQFNLLLIKSSFGGFKYLHPEMQPASNLDSPPPSNPSQ